MPNFDEPLQWSTDLDTLYNTYFNNSPSAGNKYMARTKSRNTDVETGIKPMDLSLIHI